MFAAQVDARTYGSKDKHKVILETYHSLKQGESME